jgi:hypothetical protein
LSLYAIADSLQGNEAGVRHRALLDGVIDANDFATSVPRFFSLDIVDGEAALLSLSGDSGIGGAVLSPLSALSTRGLRRAPERAGSGADIASP